MRWAENFRPSTAKFSSSSFLFSSSDPRADMKSF